MSTISKSNKRLIYPALIWFCVFFILPLMIIFIYSFTTDYIFSGGKISFYTKQFSYYLSKKTLPDNPGALALNQCNNHIFFNTVFISCRILPGEKNKI